MSTPLAKDDKGKVVVETNALNLRWTFGFNTSIPNTVHSLSTPQRHALFYVSSHTGVIHDVDHDVQQLLQGHIHPITAVCISHDKRWIATADSGKTDSMIIVWDANKAAPVKIIPQQESHGGIAAMDMSNDALFLVTLSQSYPQQLSIWEWTITTTTPTITTSVGDHEYQHCIRFNPVDVRDIVTNGQKQVIFWNWTDQALAAFHPPRGITKLKKSISSLTQTTFIPYTTKAVTATSSGHVILWDYPVSELVQSTGRDAIKVLKIVKAPINLIDTVLDKYLVCACGDAVRFFDFQFRVVAWFEDIIAGTVTSISFAHGMNGENKGTTVNNGIVSMDDFFVPDFVVGTAHGKILQLDSRTMDQLTPEKRRGRLFVQGFDDHVHALDAHPNLPLFVVGTRSGALQIWDIDERKISASRSFTAQDMIHENKHTSDTCDIRVVKYGPRGILLALGFANGMVKIVASHETNVTDTTLTTTPLRDIASFRRSTSAITHIAWSSDGQYMATADADMCVGLYRYYHRDEDIEKPMEWIDVGKYRSHYKTIISLYFESGTRRLAEAEEEARRAELEAHTKPHVEEKEPEKRTIVKKGKRLPTRGKTAPTTATRGASYAPRLFSLGEDRILQEYDLITSNIRSGITLATSTRMEQCAIPTAMMAMAGRPIKRSGEDKKEGDKVEYSPDLLITANDEYKLKVWQLKTPNKSGDPDDEPDKICRKTLLAPTYGGPINKLMILPKREGSRIIPSQFLIYSTAEKIVGLIKLPLDGNPNKSMALIAHPAEISCCVCSFDGRYLITAGGGDRCVNLWSISTNALEASIALSGGTGMEPYMSLMEGGKDGAFYQEMLDYFYYAQLRSQGVNTTGPRKIPGLIPLREVIHVMRALGFYPTEQQIADIHTEIRYAHSHYTRVADRELVNLEELIKLYVNHRPVHGLRKEELEGAFHLLQKLSNTESTDDIPHTSMSPHELIQQLTTLGEKMSISELEKCLESLVGEVKDDGGNPLLARLPSDIDATSFASDILGFTPESQS